MNEMKNCARTKCVCASVAGSVTSASDVSRSSKAGALSRSHKSARSGPAVLMTSSSEGYFYRIRGTRNIIETIGEQPDDDLFVRVHITRQQFEAQELLNREDTNRQR